MSAENRPEGFVHPVFKQPNRGPPSDCSHETFATEAVVNRLADQTPMAFMLDLKVKCNVCGTRFRFKGLPGGVNFDRPTCDALALEARMPIEPCR